MSKVNIDLKRKSYPDYESLIQILIDLDYDRVPMVLEPGEFAVRGDIIDIFASNHSHPVRIEYFDKEIERLNAFNPHNQRSLSDISETEIQKAENTKNRIWVSDFSEADDNILISFQKDDFVVHENFGVGQFVGFIRLKLQEQEGEYAHIKYKGEDKVYVPLDQFHMIHKYAGKEADPRVNGLHDGSWKKTKAKAKKEVQEIAEDIYLLYKIRLMKAGYVFNEDTPQQIELEEAFPHELTRDQKKAIQAIKEDMEADIPMDRLLCGDVGYGKTELMLRAAFKAVENKKQVAILVPTTVLAEQHFHTFNERFKSFGYKVDVMSRFKTKKQQRESLEQLRRHQTNVIIGTHRLLQKDVVIADLGLLMVDEEQRFGVSHKERIKQIKQLVDVISVSATPIPRTMYLALSGAKDLSIIETPPRAKKPVITQVAEFDEEKIIRAIKTELKRKGQIFYIYNRVQTIERKASVLKKIFPKIKIGVAHGQMNEKDLFKVMMDFESGIIKILVCTTLIENGLDITNANTIILEKANYFGLSQIHQLRGRVGRSSVQAYCYLFFDSSRSLSTNGWQRLQAIREYTALGSGYKLALKDLEIRGAGELLGTQQSGQATRIGFQLYCKMLEDAVTDAKGESRKEKTRLDVNSHKIQLPESYIENARERFAIYSRFYLLEGRQDLKSLEEELVDRYGKMNDSALKVFDYLNQKLR